MDIATILGLVVGIGSVLISFLMEGGHLSALIQVPAMILVICGTFGAACVTTSVKQLINLPSLIRVAFFEKKMDTPPGLSTCSPTFRKRPGKTGF